MLEAGQLGATEHDGRARGVVENGGHPAAQPEAQERHGHCVDIRQQHPHPRGVARQQHVPLPSQQPGSHQQATIGQGLGYILHRHLAGPPPRRLEDRFRHRAGSVLHLDAKLLGQHLVPEPVSQPGAGLGRAGILPLRWGQELAEVSADSWKKLLLVAIAGKRQPKRAAQMAGDDPGVGFVQEKAGAVEELHEGAGGRDAAFGKQHEPSAGLQVLGHAPRRVGGERIHRKTAAVGHHEPMQW